jgi:hypothetical protein
MDFNKALENRNFQGVFIPASLYLNKSLTWVEKILIVEIDSLDKEVDGKRIGCYASSKYLALFLQISEGRCANIISNLRSRNIIIDRKKYDGKNRYIGIDFSAIKYEDSHKREQPLNANVNSHFTETLSATSHKREPIIEYINTNINTDYKKENAEKSAIFESEKNEDAVLEVEPLVEPKVKAQSKKENSGFSISLLPANFPPALIPYAEKFFEYRREIKRPYKTGSSLTAKLNKFIEEAEKYGVQAVIESIETAIGQGWTGTFIDKKYQNAANKKPTAQTIPISEQAQRDELTLLKTKCHNKRIDFTHITGSISEQIIQIKKLL